MDIGRRQAIFQMDIMSPPIKTLGAFWVAGRGKNGYTDKHIQPRPMSAEISDVFESGENQEERKRNYWLRQIVLLNEELEGLAG